MAKAESVAAAAPEDVPEDVPEVSGEAPEGFHRMTVLKNGAGKIHTGREDRPVGDTFARGDSFHAPLESAHSLEARGFAEADGELPPLPVEGDEA